MVSNKQFRQQFVGMIWKVLALIAISAIGVTASSRPQIIDPNDPPQWVRVTVQGAGLFEHARNCPHRGQSDDDLALSDISVLINNECFGWIEEPFPVRSEHLVFSVDLAGAVPQPVLIEGTTPQDPMDVVVVWNRMQE